MDVASNEKKRKEKLKLAIEICMSIFYPLLLRFSQPLRYVYRITQQDLFNGAYEICSRSSLDKTTLYQQAFNES